MDSSNGEAGQINRLRGTSESTTGRFLNIIDPDKHCSIDVDTDTVVQDVLVLVEDDPEDAFLYEQYIENSSHKFGEVIYFDNLKNAYSYLRTNTPRCCILDNKLPDGNAIELLRKLLDSSGYIPFPIIVSTSQGNERTAVELMKLGIQDYIVKRDLSTDIFDESIALATQRHVNQTELLYQATHDPLTGLLNRQAFLNKLNHIFKEARRYNRAFELCFIDVDNFKQINDTYGHGVGDEVLKYIADLLQSNLRETDVITRMGGDEFVLIIQESTPAESKQIAQKLQKSLTLPLQFNGHSFKLSLSIGIASYDETCESTAELTNRADQALYRTKENGRGHYTHFKDGLYS